MKDKKEVNTGIHRAVILYKAIDASPDERASIKTNKIRERNKNIIYIIYIIYFCLFFKKELIASRIFCGQH